MTDWQTFWQKLLFSENQQLIHDIIEQAWKTEGYQVAPDHIDVQKPLEKQEEPHLNKESAHAGTIVGHETRPKALTVRIRLNTITPNTIVRHQIVGHHSTLKRDGRREQILAPIRTGKQIVAAQP